jgi:23S rRNA pseudouridine2605 synthase
MKLRRGMKPERLQKVLAACGLGSRRYCDKLVAQGRVTVNSQPAFLGQLVDPEHDVIYVDGEQVGTAETQIYILLNKPPGVVSSSRAQGRRQTILELVNLPQHLFPVGRLDLASEGLMLLTNDGALANRLSHPRYGHEKEYRVLLNHPPDEGQLQRWRAGVVLEDGDQTPPVKVKRENPGGLGAWVRVVMQQGRRRQIRLTAEALGLQVKRLIRIRIDGLLMGNLAPGEWRLATAQEISHLRNLLARPPAAGADPSSRSGRRGRPGPKRKSGLGERAGSKA